MDTDLAQKAVSEAMKGNWKEAVSLNKKILAETPNDVDALNRLARAYAECGEVKQSKKTSEKVLKLDPTNSIAAKSLKKLKGAKKSEVIAVTQVSPAAFLEEPGKTKIVPLLCLGDKAQLAKLNPGDEVKLAPHGHRVSIISQNGKYLGRLTDDLSARLRGLIKNKYEYQVLVKSVDETGIKIFIRETARGQKCADVPSFPAEKIDYISYTPPELVSAKDTTVFTQEQEGESEA
jgi:tetratricopeptide (TPR) repeat protein